MVRFVVVETRWVRQLEFCAIDFHDCFHAAFDFAAFQVLSSSLMFGAIRSKKETVTDGKTVPPPLFSNINGNS
jgi:hypothetical protein